MPFSDQVFDQTKEKDKMDEMEGIGEDATWNDEVGMMRVGMKEAPATSYTGVNITIPPMLAAWRSVFSKPDGVVAHRRPTHDRRKRIACRARVGPIRDGVVRFWDLV